LGEPFSEASAVAPPPPPSPSTNALSSAKERFPGSRAPEPVFPLARLALLAPFADMPATLAPASPSAANTEAAPEVTDGRRALRCVMGTGGSATSAGSGGNGCGWWFRGPERTRGHVVVDR
jgi:hypothetical protein